jgi:uncharacterized pyridoxamine 5'-phosphate oxidase family protein
MKEVVKFLTENPVQYLATVGLDGKPKVRPFQFMLEQDGKLYYCTNNTKQAYKEIQKRPYVEICTCSPAYAWLRLSGKVVFSKDLSIKKKIVESHDLLKTLYKTAENPIFEIFYLENAKAVISDFSGNPPKEYSLGG